MAEVERQREPKGEGYLPWLLPVKFCLESIVTFDAPPHVVTPDWPGTPRRTEYDRELAGMERKALCRKDGQFTVCDAAAVLLAAGKGRQGGHLSANSIRPCQQVGQNQGRRGSLWMDQDRGAVECTSWKGGHSADSRHGRLGRLAAGRWSLVPWMLDAGCWMLDRDPIDSVKTHLDTQVFPFG